jgi:hypothetical protein
MMPSFEKEPAMKERNRSLVFAISLVVALCVAASMPMLAQTSTSTLIGSVVDGSGAIVPGATVTATHVATTTVRTGMSNEAGLFRIAALAPGEYSLVVDLAGFKPVTVQQIQLVSSETRDLGKLALEVGTQAENVTVTAEVTPIQFASAERSATVTGDQLQNIQLKGRDVFGFTSILPGILDTNNNRDFTTWTSMRDISINGAPSGSKNVTIDGVNVIDEGANQNAFVNPNIDAVSEVRVLTNGFQAEFGRNAGGTINIITKGGTNRVRGSAWYNARRDEWNANDFIRNSQGLPKPLYEVNISGYSIGGPIVIPKVTTSSNRRLFFFVSQEYTNDKRPVATVLANLPTPAERRGDFSDTRQTNGSLLVIRDPLTGQPFPGNIIPQDRLNPTGRAILDLMPQPNGYTDPRQGQQFTANFQSQNSPKHFRRDDVVRVDANLTDRTSMYVKYIRDREDTVSYDAVAPGVGSLLNFVPGWIVTGHVTQVLGGSTVNEITLGYGHNNFGNRRPDGEDHSQYFRSAVGVNPPRLEPFAQVPSGEPVIEGLQNDEWPYVPIFTFAGGNRTNLPGYFPGTTNGGGRVLPQANRNDRIQIQDDLSKTAGRHNLKTGVYVEYSSKTEPNIGSNYLGNFNFGSTPDNPLDTGYGYANALLGVFQSYTESPNRANPDMRQWQVEGYVQDNWRVSSRFTLDYGVRFYHSGPYSDQYANAGFFEESYSQSSVPRLYRPICLTGVPGNQACPAASQRAQDPLTGQIVPFAYQGNFVPGSGNALNGIQPGGRTGNGDYYDYPPIEVAPRVGFAWDVRGDGRTSLRASAGTFYNRVGKGGYNAFLVSSAVVQDKVIRYGRIDDIPSLAQTAVLSPISGVGRAGLQRDLERAYEANVTIQHDLGFNTMVEAAYVMNLVRNSQQNNEVNPIPLYAYGNPANLFNNAPINANFLRTTYPGLGSVVDVVTDVESLNYHGLQMQL